MHGGLRMSDTALHLPPPFALRDVRGRLATRLYGLPYRARPVERIEGVAVHATEVDTSAEELALYQTAKLEGDPFPAIAYHFVVRADGTVEWCHDLEVETWHAGAAGSATHLSLCVAGAGGDTGLPGDVQVDAARALLAALEARLGHPLRVRAHADLLPVAARCPGRRWPEWRDRLAVERP